MIKLYFDAQRASFRNIQKNNMGQQPPQVQGAPEHPGLPESA